MAGHSAKGVDSYRGPASMQQEVWMGVVACLVAISKKALVCCAALCRPTAEITRSALRASVLRTLEQLNLTPWPAPVFDGMATPHIGLLLMPGAGAGTLSTASSFESVDGSASSSGGAAAGAGAEKKTALQVPLSLAIELLDPSACLRNEPHPAIGPVQSR